MKIIEYHQRYNLTTFPNMLGHQDITAVDDITPKIKDVVDSGYLNYDDVDKDGDDDVDSMLMMVTLQDHGDNIYFSLSKITKL